VTTSGGIAEMRHIPKTTLSLPVYHLPGEYCSIQRVLLETCRGHARGKDERVCVADAFLHKASVSACGIGTTVVGLTQNNLRRSHRHCVQTCLVQGYDLPLSCHERDRLAYTI
jgi:hypothetical protein